MYLMITLEAFLFMIGIGPSYLISGNSIRKYWLLLPHLFSCEYVTFETFLEM